MPTDQSTIAVPAYDSTRLAPAPVGGVSRSLVVAGVVGLSSVPVALELLLDLFSH